MAKYRPKAISFDAEFDHRKNLWWVDWPVCRWFNSEEFERLYEEVPEEKSKAYDYVDGLPCTTDGKDPSR